MSTNPKLIERFRRRQYDDAKTGRFQLRLYPEQLAAFEQAAIASGIVDVSAWARKVLDDAARKVLAEE